MAKQIKVEGKIHSFPDDATDEEINQLLGGSQQDEGILSSVGSEISGAAHMPLGRSLKNIGQGALEFGELLANPAGPGMKYLAEKDIPYVSAAAKKWPQFPDSDVFELGEKQPGDTLFQAASPAPPIFKGAKLGANALEQITKKALSQAPKVMDKAGDAFPIIKSVASKPYKKQMQVLEEKNLMGGYKPNTSDILEASRVLKSPGMTIPHEAIDEAVANAINGNFKPWFRLQSSVRSEGRRLSKKGGVHSELGEKLHSLSEKMHSDMGEAQAARGAPEAKDYMEQGKARTARYHKISPYSKLATGVAAAAALPKWVNQMLKALSK